MKIDGAFADGVLEFALHQGADKAEVFAAVSKSITAEARDGAVDALERADGGGFSVRILKGGRLGFAYSTDTARWRQVVDAAVESARWTARDEYLELPSAAEAGVDAAAASAAITGLDAATDAAACTASGAAAACTAGRYPHVEIHDPAIDSADSEVVMDMAAALERAALRFDPRVLKVRKAQASVSSSRVLIANTMGLQGGYRATRASLSISALCEDGGEKQMGWEYDGARFLNDVSVERTAANAASRAVRLMGSRRFKTARKCAVALENHVAVDFLEVLASSLSSENVQKGKSMLADKTGLKIISQRMSLVDDALLARATGSRPFDAEGVASRRNILVEGGVLRGFSYNTYTAKKGGVGSTGSAVRGGISSIPGVGFSNLYIEPVSTEFVYAAGDLLWVYDKCLLITDVMGMHTANTVSGDFSVGVNGLWIEGGEVGYPVKEAVVSGNILGFFEKVEAFGDDLKFYGSTGSPSLLVGDVEISA